jgi:hypothetical protein
VEPVGAVIGVALVLLTMWDLFQTIVVPRPSPGRFRLARYVVRGSWRAVRWLARRSSPAVRDSLLGMFGPAAAVLLLVTWLAAFIVGFGLVLYSIRDQLLPVPPDLATTLYFTAVSVTTLGFGEIVAQ